MSEAATRPSRPMKGSSVLRVLVSTAVALVVAAVSLALWLATSNGRFDPDSIPYSLSFVAFALVGALVVNRRPHEPIGWLLVALGLFPAVAIFAQQYVTYSLTVAPRPLPGTVGLAWLGNWTIFPTLGMLVVLLPLLFPTGKPPSPRWRPVVAIGLTTVALSAVSGMFAPGVLEFVASESGRRVDNPLGLASLGGLIGLLDEAVWPAFSLLAVVALASLVVRFRTAGPEERLQLKWLLFALSVGLPTLLVAEWVLDALPAGDTALDTVVGVAGAAVVWVGLPVAVGVAILRHRLYEIDRVVSRTVSYALLTALLVGVYAAGVVGGGALVRSLTGGSGGDLVVAASTLAAAGLFGPARRRIQRGVDRRFNRSRYDARRIVEDFAAALRDEVDLDVLAAEVRRAAGATMQPAHASMWLHPAAASRAGISPGASSPGIVVPGDGR